MADVVKEGVSCSKFGVKFFPVHRVLKKDGKLPVGEVKKVSRKEQQADLQERASQESNLESSDP